MKSTILLHAFAQHSIQQLRTYSAVFNQQPTPAVYIWNFTPPNQHRYISDSLSRTINLNKYGVVRDLNKFVSDERSNGRQVVAFRSLNQQMDTALSTAGVILIAPLWFLTKDQVQEWYKQKSGRVLLQQFYKQQVQSFGLDARFAKSRDKENRTPIPKSGFDARGLGSLQYIYSHQQAMDLLEQFIRTRFKHFATYQDAILPPTPESSNSVTVHSALSMAINTGLILPQQILTRIYQEGYSRQSEAFIRQLLGWREFAICYYQFKPLQWTRFKGNVRKLSSAWYKQNYKGEIKKQIDLHPIIRDILVVIWDSGYIHHIPRLYLLSFMIQLELHPREIFDWMNQHFVDANDWVMTFNVYAMGGFDTRFTSKTYLFSSGYYVDQSAGRYKRDSALDSLYRTFIHKYPQYMRQASDQIDKQAVINLQRLFTRL